MANGSSNTSNCFWNSWNSGLVYSFLIDGGKICWYNLVQYSHVFIISFLLGCLTQGFFNFFHSIASVSVHIVVTNKKWHKNRAAVSFCEKFLWSLYPFRDNCWSVIWSMLGDIANICPSSIFNWHWSLTFQTHFLPFIILSIPLNKISSIICSSGKILLIL